MDRISSLPDGAITHILSFLPIKEAASTSVLAKRWRILFAFSSNLQLLEYDEEKLQCFMAFVDRVLSVSGHSPIKKFTLQCPEGFEHHHMTRWMSNVLNRGVMDLDLEIDDNYMDGYSLPFKIFTCKTLVKLKLCGYLVTELPENAFLPALQTLSLERVKFYSLEVCAFKTLLSACPVLEDLSVTDLNWEEWKWCRSVSSPSLQRLTIDRTKFDGFDGSDFGSITFDTPNLTYLRYCDLIPGSYPVVNLDSLVEANYDLVVTVDHTWDSLLADENDNITSNATNLIKGLRNVEIMNLLSHESLEGPLNAEQSGFGSSGYSCLLSCPVKVIKITKSSVTSEEVEQLKHFLGKLPRLKLLEVNISGASDKKFQIAKDLLMLPRASSKCKIKVN